MDNLIRNYREEHRRCKWCRYYKFHASPMFYPCGNGSDFATCQLKDKILKTDLSAIFCRYYNIKE